MRLFFGKKYLGVYQLAAWMLALFLVGGASACARVTPSPTPMQLSPTTGTTSSPVPEGTASPTLTITPSPTHGQAVWENFPPPRITPITPIPPPLTGLAIPEEARVLAIAGVDRVYPYTGRTDALALVIYHPRLARASLISIPPDLLGYIPGYTMQRMYTAYPVGGPRMLTSALEYNFGLKPDHYAVFNLDSFRQLIDDLEGINVTVLENVQRYCPAIPPGTVFMRGDAALCYMRLRLGEDEGARNRRQQEVLRSVFLRLVENGNFIRVPELYAKYRTSIDSNLTLDEIIKAMPLSLKLGDPNRIGYFQLGEKELGTWEISEQPPATVFLPDRPALMAFLQQAVNYITTPSPLSDVVTTLEYQLTSSPTPTGTYTITPTPTATRRPTSLVRNSPTPTATSRTITPAPSASPSPTITPTRTATP